MAWSHRSAMRPLSPAIAMAQARWATAEAAGNTLPRSYRNRMDKWAEQLRRLGRRRRGHNWRQSPAWDNPGRELSSDRDGNRVGRVERGPIAYGPGYADRGLDSGRSMASARGSCT